jgi:hypothetical protein
MTRTRLRRGDGSALTAHARLSSPSTLFCHLFFLVSSSYSEPSIGVERWTDRLTTSDYLLVALAWQRTTFSGLPHRTAMAWFGFLRFWRAALTYGWRLLAAVTALLLLAAATYPFHRRLYGFFSRSWRLTLLPYLNSCLFARAVLHLICA